MAGESPWPSGVRSNSSAATGMPRQVVSNTRSSQPGLCFSRPNAMAGGWSPNATITRHRASEIKVDIERAAVACSLDAEQVD